MQIYTPAPTPSTDALNAAPLEWTGVVRSGLAQRGNPATEPEILRLAKQLQRLHPAAIEAMSSSPSDRVTDSGLADDSVEFNQTLRSLAA